MKVNWRPDMLNVVADLEMRDALTLKRAEMWLDVGRPILALQEMEVLGGCSWGHPWAIRLLNAICQDSTCPATGSAKPPVSTTGIYRDGFDTNSGSGINRVTEFAN